MKNNNMIPQVNPELNSVGAQEKQKPLTQDEIKALLKADPRYIFTGEWVPFASDYISDALESSPFRPVGYSEQPALQHGKVEQIDNRQQILNHACFMPTKNAEFTKLDDTHVSLSDGAILVHAGDQPVKVTTDVKGHKVVTKVGAGALAMISAFDQKTTILHLTDNSKGGLISHLPTTRENYKAISLNAGEIAEIYDVNQAPSSHVVSTKIHVNERLSNDKALLISNAHYVRAMKKYNLVGMLHKHDYDRVLKTAAAVGYVRRP